MEDNIQPSTSVEPPFLLSVHQPFDLASSAESGQAHRWRREVRDGDEVWYSGVIHGNHMRVRQRVGDSAGPSHILEIRSAPRSEPRYLKPLLDSYFRLDDDIDGIYREITKEPRVADMVRRHWGLRLLRQEPWECLIAFICSANSNIPRIHANMEAISRNFGRPVKLDGEVRHTFPSPGGLAEAGESALRRLGLGFRAPYVANASSAVAAGDLDLETLRRMPYQEAKARLIELPGIGPKVADCVLLHSLDHLEAFPIDVWVRRALRDWYFQDRKAPTDRVMLEWAQGYFNSFGGYSQMYLFHGRRLER